MNLVNSGEGTATASAKLWKAVMAYIGLNGEVMSRGRKYKMRGAMEIIKHPMSVVVLCGLWCAQALGANSVVVESKTVFLGATGVTIGVYIANDVDLTALVLPLELRAIDPGSYIANSLTLTVQGRVAGSGLMDLVSGPYYSPAPGACNCSGPTSSSFDVDKLGAVDFVSPDGVFWAGVNTIDPCLVAGSDGSPGSGTASFLFTFDVTSTPGMFEIDTCCHSPANHLLFVPCGTATGVTPAFTKGQVQIVECDCGLWGDVTGDRTINPVDVVYMVQYVYLSHDIRVQPPNCPRDGGDVNCDGDINPVDVVFYVNYVYLSIDMFCPDPCEE